MRILLTGSTGFIGSRLAEDLLAQGFNLNLIVIRKDEVRPNIASSSNVKIFERDIFNDDLSDAFEDVGVVLHLAAIRHRWGVKRKDYMETNNGLTNKLLAASQKAKIKQFILCSSIAVFGWPKSGPVDEAFPYAPVNSYGESKVECEKIVRNWSKKTGIRYTIIRPSITYGEADFTGMITKYLSLMNAGKYLTVGSGKNTLQLVYVGDLVTGFRKAILNRKAYNDDFIVTSKDPVSVNELSMIIADVEKKPLPKAHIPSWIARIPATILEFFYAIGLKVTGSEPIITNEKIDLMTTSRSYDISKAERLLGYKNEVDYKQGIERVYKWNKKNNLL